MGCHGGEDQKSGGARKSKRVSGKLRKLRGETESRTKLQSALANAGATKGTLYLVVS